MSDMQKVGILYPLRESGMGGCVGKGSGTEEMRTLEKRTLSGSFRDGRGQGGDDLVGNQ